jgi:hypothetical protein
MISRREVMASGIAMTLLARTATAAVGATGPIGTCPGRVVFVADSRIPEARSAADSAAETGTECRSFASDITPVYEWLDLSFRTEPMRVAGLTTAHALFAIERLGWDRGLRTVYRGLHGAGRASAPSHAFVGARALVERLEDVERLGRLGRLGGREWPEHLGRILTGVVPGPDDHSDIVTSQQLPGHDDNALVSWLLAPRAMLQRGEPAQAGRT